MKELIEIEIDELDTLEKYPEELIHGLKSIIKSDDPNRAYGFMKGRNKIMLIKRTAKYTEKRKPK